MLVGIALLASSVSCSSADQPAAPSSSSTSVSSSSAAAATPVAPQIVQTDTLEIGDSGVRCMVGNISLACVAGPRQMTLGPVKGWSMVGAVAPPGGLEPGFTPSGELSNRPQVGDVAFLDASSCKSGGGDGRPGIESMQCRTMGMTATVGDNHDDILVGVISAVGTARATIRFTESEFELPLPEPPAPVFHRLAPGRRLTQDHPVKIRPWTFTLRGDKLTVGGPYGESVIGVGP